MTRKTLPPSLQHQKKLEFYDPSGFYFGSIAAAGISQLDSNPTLLLLSYDEKLSFYNTQGKRITQLPFSSDASAVFIEDLFNDANPVYISCTFSGEIRVFAENGDEIWQKQMESSILGGIIGNLDYDQQPEIILMLDNNSLVVLNNQGQVVAKYQHHTQIMFVAIGKVHSSKNKVILFSDVGNDLYVLDVEDTVTSLEIPIKKIRSLATLTIYDKILLLIVDENNVLHILNKKGQIYLSFPVHKPILAAFTGYLFSKYEQTIALLTEDSHVLLYEMKATNPALFQLEDGAHSPYNDAQERLGGKQQAETEIEGENEVSTTASLEINPSLFHSHVESNSTDNSDLHVEKSIISESASSKSYKCPDCDSFLPKSLIERIFHDQPAFCEQCGAELSRRSILTS